MSDKQSHDTRRTLEEVHADIEAARAQLEWWLGNQHLKDATSNIACIDERIRRLHREPVRSTAEATVARIADSKSTLR